MGDNQGNTGGGLVEGVGQTLTPTGPQAGPMQAQEGQWSFRYDYTQPTTLSVSVSVTFGAPFSLTTELSSQMDSKQVGSLKDWLTGVWNQMNAK
jgi:hypothetical protein